VLANVSEALYQGRKSLASLAAGCHPKRIRSLALYLTRSAERADLDVASTTPR
jgi:hypothetical protein